MKKPWVWLRVLALGAMVLFGLGCRTNLLPEYAGRFKSTHAEVRVNSVGYVAVKTGSDKKNKSVTQQIADTAVGVAAANAAVKAEEKLQAAMPPERVQRIVTKEVLKAAPNVGFPFVGGEVPSDTRLIVEVRRYGIDATNSQSPAVARFQMYGALTYLPEGKLIWEYSVWVEIPLSSVHVTSANSTLAGDLSNVIALSSLDKRDVKRLFSAATRIATQRFMDKLSREYAEGLAKYQAKYGAGGPYKAPAPPAPETGDDDDDDEEAPAPTTPNAPAEPQKTPGNEI